MRFVYDVEITPQEDGSHLVTFPQVPGAVTDGDSIEEARKMAADCLIAALGGYMRLGHPIPASGTGNDTVAVPPVQAAKLALYEAMRTNRVSNAELGRRLGISEGAVRRLVDLDHRSHIDHVDRALEALGMRLLVSVEAA